MTTMMPFSQMFLVGEVIEGLKFRWDNVRLLLIEDEDIDVGELSPRCAKVIIEQAALDALCEQTSKAVTNRVGVTRAAVESLAPDFYHYLDSDLVDGPIIDDTVEELKRLLSDPISSTDPFYSLWDASLNRHAITVKYLGDHRIKEWEKVNLERTVRLEGKLTFRVDFNDIFDKCTEYFNLCRATFEREDVWNGIANYASRKDHGIYEHMRKLFREYSSIEMDAFPAIMDELDELINSTGILEYEGYILAAMAVRVSISRSIVTYYVTGITTSEVGVISKMIQEYDVSEENSDYIPEGQRRLLEDAKRQYR